MKNWLNRKEKHSMPSVNVKIEEVVRSQMQDLELAVYGNGSYDLSDDFRYLRKERHVWNALNQSERKDALDQFKSSKPKKIDEPLPRLRTDKHETVPKASIIPSAVGLSIKSDGLFFPGVGDELLQELWTKAESLVRMEDSFTKAPGFTGCYVRHSFETHHKPHLVTATNRGRVVCHDCPLYNNLKICSHSVAGANFLSILPKYVDWRKKENIVSSFLSDLVFEGAKGGKKKTAKPRRGGRAPLSVHAQQSAAAVERHPLVEDESTAVSIIQDLEDFDTEPKFELLYLFQTKASVCYGCNKKFDRESEQNKLVIRKFCEREFKKDGEMRKKWQYAYFHLKKICVNYKFKEFSLSDAKIASEALTIVPDDVKEKLLSHGVTV